jgi:heme/copper-type cytochrome/quinol oxidase subunit 3
MSTITPPAPDLVDHHAVRRAGSPVIAMTIFVASEAVFFGAFFGIYATAYTSASTWPPAGVPGPSVVLPSVGAGVVLVSGLTMAQVLRVARQPEYPRGVMAGLAATLLLAVVFGVVVAAGYHGLGFGVGQGIYESLFYVILGLEVAHVVGGVALLALVLVRGWVGELALSRDPVLAAGIYWEFVVVLGLVIYVVLYLAAAG